MARFSPIRGGRRENPRISANELARFMVAGDTGRIGIIRNARDYTTPSRIRYSGVRQEIKDYLCDMGRSDRSLNAMRLRFEQKAADPALGTWDREDARLSVDVLKALARMNNQISGARFAAAPSRQAPLIMAGVTVNIQLEVLMTRTKGATEEIGGVLFRMTKADDETDAAATKRRDMGAYAATLALLQTQTHLAGSAQPHHQLCASFDIQCEEVHYAPRAYTARSRNLENACRFIAAMWETA